MYEFLCKGKAGLNVKYKAVFAIIIFAMCAIIAIAAPLRVYAASTVLQEIVSVLIGLLGGYAGWQLAVAGIAGGSLIAASLPEIILVVLISMGVSLTVQMIYQSLCTACDNGSMSLLLDKIAEPIKNGELKASNGVLTCPLFLSTLLYDWVKEHIVGFYDVKEEVTTGEASSIPIVWATDYNWNNQGGISYFRGMPVQNHNGEGPSYSYGWCPGFLSWVTPSSNLRNVVTLGSIENNGIQIDFDNNTNTVYDQTLDNNVCAVKFTFNEDLSVVCTVNSEVTASRTMSLGVPQLKGNELFVNICSYSVKTSGSNYVYKGDVNSPRAGISYFSYNNKIYKLKSFPYYSYPSEANKYILCEDMNGKEYKLLVFSEAGELLGCSYNTNLLKYLVCDNASIGISAVSGESVVDKASSQNKSYNVSNAYYNEKSDVLKTVVGNIKSKADSGDVTEQTAGTVAIGVTSTAATAVNSTTADTTVTDSAAVTDVAVEGVAAEVGAIDIAPSTAMMIALNNIKMSAGDLKYKFPFDVIYSSASWLQVLVTPGEPLVIDYEFTVPNFQNPVHVHIDFNKYQDLVWNNHIL